MKTKSRALIAVVGLLSLYNPQARAAESPYDVDVTLTNPFDKDFADLPVIMTVAQVFGRGLPWDKFEKANYHIYDDKGAELEYSYRPMPPYFSPATDELVLYLPKLAKGQTVSLRVVNDDKPSRKQVAFNMEKLLNNPNNLMPNPGFEKGAEGWEGGAIAQDSKVSGKNALLIEVPGAGGKLTVTSAAAIPFAKDGSYYFGLWAKSENVVRHSYRWENAGLRVFWSGNPSGPLKLKFPNSFDDRTKPQTHFRIMDTQDWGYFKASSPTAIAAWTGGTSRLTMSMNQFQKPFVDAGKPARVWIDDILVFEQPVVAYSWERMTAKLTTGGFFVYRRAPTCTASTFGTIEPPKPCEKIAKIEENALLGERKLIQFGLHSEKPVADVSLEIGDLAGPGGASLPASAVEVEFNYTPLKDWKFTPTSLEGWALDGNTPRTMDRPGFADYFLGYRIPVDAKPGVYRGTVKIKGDGKELAGIPVSLEVHALPLAVITDRFMGEIYNNGCGPAANTGAVLPPRDTAYYRYYSRCNFTMLMMFSHFLPYTGKGPEVDIPKLLERVKELRDVGGCTAGVGLYWDCKLDNKAGTPYGGRGIWARCGLKPEPYRAEVKKMDDALAAAKLPRLIYMLWDEPRFFDDRLKILKGTGALTTSDIFANEGLAAMADKCFTHMSFDDPSYEPGPALYAYAKKLGIRFGMAGWPSQGCVRYQTGMLYATSGMNYWHHWYGNQFIGWHKEFKTFCRGSNSIGMGEGMIDLRYFETLQGLIERARAAGKAAKEVAAAEAYLKEIFAYCTGDWYWVGVVNGTAEGDWQDDWFYDGWRSQMRQHALAIAEKM